jgi:hypothetical protein
MSPKESRRVVHLGKSGRLTLRCSGLGRHKVHGRGRSAYRHNQLWHVRVLQRPWPAAELGS